MSYDNWRKRLEIAKKYSTVAERRVAVAALKINFSQPGEADEGYYRKPITIKDPSGNGLNIITGWIPVSYFMSDASSADGRELCGVIGAGADARNMTDAEVGDEQLWSYVVSHPIPYEWYSAVADHGDPWPDQPPGKNTAIIEALETAYPSPDPDAIERTVGRGDNNPPELLPEVEHANAIDNAIGAAKDLKVTTLQEAAVAAGAANVIRDRRLAAEKIAKVKIEPLQRAYEEERNKWLPLVKRAKDAEGMLRGAVSTFEFAEKKRVIKEQQDALERQRLQDEANARAADRAIAAGEPEQAPVVDEVVIPKVPDRVTPTYGGYKPRQQEPKKFAVINDDVEVYKFLRANNELKELLQKLATNAIRAGFEVPGATTREGLV
jgi:hypothetical protein